MMHVSKVNFKIGISTKKDKTQNLEWRECQIEITLTEGDNPENAKELAETYLKAWLEESK